jgi:hypothetical protein
VGEQGFLLVGHENAVTPADFRRPTRGPEFEMLVEYLKCGLPMPKRSESLAVFLEPRLETGWPDAVAVYWRSDRGLRPDAACQLQHADDRLLHFIWLEGTVSHAGISARYGPTVAQRALDLLTLGAVVENRNRGLRVRKSTLAVTRLIAIEAKVSAPRSALSQAARNAWYASESYVLLPQLPTGRTLRSQYASCGVGIVTPDDHLESPPVPAHVFDLPRSHGTWRFNRMALHSPTTRAV